MEKIGGKIQDIGKVDVDAVVRELFPGDDQDWYGRPEVESRMEERKYHPSPRKK